MDCGRNATLFLKSSVVGQDLDACGGSAISQSFVVAIVLVVSHRTSRNDELRAQ